MDEDTSFAPGTVMPKRRRRRLGARLFPYLLIAPAVLLVLAVVVYPALYAMRVSTMSQNLLRMALAEYIGPGNYLHAIEDPIFLTSLGNTARWVVVVAGAQLALALPIALLLNTDYRGRGIVRTSILIPWVAPPAVVAILWIYMFDANFGIVNDILVRLGAIESYVAWRSLPVPSFSMLVAAMAWTGFPFFAIVLLAALQAIPDDLYEAARVDGAGVWQRFRFITLPLLIPTILLVLLLRTIWLSQSVDLIYLMTGGGPGYFNYTVALYSFLLTYHQLELGYPSALAIILSVVLLALSGVYIHFIERARESQR